MTDESTSADPMQCDRCGQPHAAGCAGHRRDGAPCGNQPMAGQRVCRMHGGSAPQARAAAERRQEEARVAEAMARGLAAAYGDQVPDIDPAAAMLRAVSWKYAEVVALRAVVAELDDGERVWGVVRDKTGGEDFGVTRESRPSVWWVMLREAERDLVRFSKAAHDMGIAEQQIVLEQAKAERVVSAVRVGLDALPGLLPADRDGFLRAFLGALRPEGGPVVGGEVTA